MGGWSKGSGLRHGKEAIRWLKARGEDNGKMPGPRPAGGRTGKLQDSGSGGKGVAVIPTGIEAVAEDSSPNGEDVLRSGAGPKHSRLLEALVCHGSVSRFHSALAVAAST